MSKSKARKKVSSAKRSKTNKSLPKKWHAVPLKGSFMAISILGFFITTYLVYPQNFNYGLTFMLIFVAMFIASLISVTKAPIIEN